MGHWAGIQWVLLVVILGSSNGKKEGQQTQPMLGMWYTRKGCCCLNNSVCKWSLPIQSSLVAKTTLWDTRKPAHSITEGQKRQLKIHTQTLRKAPSAPPDVSGYCYQGKIAFDFSQDSSQKSGIGHADHGSKGELRLQKQTVTFSNAWYWPLLLYNYLTSKPVICSPK